MNPSVQDLITEPQMAALHILDAALETTITAVTAAHADVLWQDEMPGLAFERRPDYALVRAAEEILEHAETLRYAIAAYAPDLTPPWEASQLPLGLPEDQDAPF